MPKPKPRRKKRIIRKVRINRSELKNIEFSYKKTDLLNKFTNEQGAIFSRSITGLSQKQQKQLTAEVKRARQLALIPFTQTL